MIKKRNSGRRGGGLPRRDVQRIRDAMEKLRGRPFQVRDFVQVVAGLRHDQPGYHLQQVRFYTIVRSGAIAVLKVGDAGRERENYRFYKVVDPDKWRPRILKDHSRRERAATLATLIQRNHTPVAQETSLDLSNLGQLIDAAVKDAMEKAGIARRRSSGGFGTGEYTFCLVRAEEVGRANAVAVLRRMAEDKMHTWGLAEHEYLRDHLVLSTSNPLPSIPQWRELGIEILGTVKARSKAEAEAELLAVVTTPDGSFSTRAVAP